MEQQEEIRRLFHVLRKTGEMARELSFSDGEGAGGAYLAGQYNRILARLTQVRPEIEGLFAPLGDDTSLEVVALACHQLAAYFAEEVRAGRRAERQEGRFYESVFDLGPFKIMIGEDFEDLRNLGKTIRRAMREHKRHHRHGAGFHCGGRGGFAAGFGPEVEEEEEEEREEKS